MPDIQMRFDKDMLVLSAPLRSVLARQGVDVDRDLEYMLLVEPEALRDTVRMEKIAGAQCLVAATEGIAPARLAHKGMEERGTELALAALGMLRPLKPQHLLAEIGPCGLPLDGSSADSLNENRAQYARAAHAFDGQMLDALFLTGFKRPDDVKCAHGSTVGQLNDAALFYMRQRGIPLKEAKLLLEFAFINEVIDHMQLSPLRDRLHYLVEKRFRGELSKCEGCRLCK